MTAPLVYGSSRRPLPDRVVAGPKPAEVVSALRWLGLVSEAYERDGRGSLWERLAEQVMRCPWCGSATWSRLHDLIYHVEVERDRLERVQLERLYDELDANDEDVSHLFKRRPAPWELQSDE